MSKPAPSPAERWIDCGHNECRSRSNAASGWPCMFAGKYETSVGPVGSPSPAERCATCGGSGDWDTVSPRCVECGGGGIAPQPEAASDVRLHRRPCKCEHRWDEHAGAEPRFCLVPDCECQCFIPAHTQRADEITVLEEESDALADEIAALRAAASECPAVWDTTEGALRCDLSAGHGDWHRPSENVMRELLAHDAALRAALEESEHALDVCVHMTVKAVLDRERAALA